MTLKRNEICKNGTQVKSYPVKQVCDPRGGGTRRHGGHPVQLLRRAGGRGPGPHIVELFANVDMEIPGRNLSAQATKHIAQ